MSGVFIVMDRNCSKCDTDREPRIVTRCARVPGRSLMRFRRTRECVGCGVVLQEWQPYTGWARVVVRMPLSCVE